MTVANTERQLISHLTPDCTCDHRPGDPCNASCPVHLGAGLHSAEGGMYEPAPVIGDTRACPDCGRPQHYTGTEHGWAHDALIDTWDCAGDRVAQDRAATTERARQIIADPFAAAFDGVEEAEF